MNPSAVVQQIQSWMKQERLTVKEQQDPRAEAHFLIKYPSGNQGHMFAVVVPKGRDLVAISSMTRVDEGQQKEMAKHMVEDGEEWLEWIHEGRLQLIRSAVDWGIHMGHDGKEKSGPLQAFNVSLPIWFDGLTKNEFMHALRRLWLAKLGVIHEIKYSYGPGVGTPGPVDDWAKAKGATSGKSAPASAANESSTEHEVEFDEKTTFGSGFDPSEWA
ncbi:MAG: DUF2299 family protein [Candidatus Poseidoniaceae archaeon]|jgi:hypothetical protein|tara:strand:+ start:5718 stop:6365 length:648 start_codon:yes stop_codon:yes gene_type:complete